MGIQVTVTPAELAADRSLATVWTAMESGESGGMANRSCGRPRPATCRAWLGDEQLLGGVRKGARVRDRGEVPQVPQFKSLRRLRVGLDEPGRFRL